MTARTNRITRRLMRHNRLLVMANGIVLLTLCGLWLLGMVRSPQDQKMPKITEADGFQLVDERGRMRAMLTSDRGSPELVMYDEQGREVVALRTSPDGAKLLLRQDGKVCGSLSCGKHGSKLELNSNKAPIMRTVLDLTETESHLTISQGSLEFLRLGVSPQGFPILRMADEFGTNRLLCEVNEKGPSIVISDRHGQELWKAPQ